MTDVDSRSVLRRGQFNGFTLNFTQVKSDDAVAMAQRLAVEEGLFCGISSGERDS